MSDDNFRCLYIYLSLWLAASLTNVILIQIYISSKDWAKRRVMGELTMGDDEYSSVSLAATEVLADSSQSSPSSTSTSKGSVATKGKSPMESHVGIEYPFSSDRYLLETYRNPWGEMRL